MKKKVFNQKLNLKKETVVSLSNSQMNGVYGGNAPVSTDYGYTQGRDENGFCVQPRECLKTQSGCIPTVDGCYETMINCNTGFPTCGVCPNTSGPETC